MWRRHYEEATGNRSSTKGQMKLIEYTPLTVQPALWKRVVASKKSLLIFGPQNPVRDVCRWLTCSDDTYPISSIAGDDELPKQRDTSTSFDCWGRRKSSNAQAGFYTSTVGSHQLHRSSSFTEKREQRPPYRRQHFGCLGSLLSKKKLHQAVRFAVEGVLAFAVIVIMIATAFDAEKASGHRALSDKTSVIKILEKLAVWAFLVEALVLIVARGLVLFPDAYLRQPLDFFNFCILVLCVVCLWAEGGWVGSSLPGSALKALRALAVVRLVRFVRNLQGLSEVLTALMSSGRSLCLAGGIMLFFWVQWSIVGLQVRTKKTVLPAPSPLVHHIQPFYVLCVTPNFTNLPIDRWYIVVFTSPSTCLFAQSSSVSVSFFSFSFLSCRRISRKSCCIAWLCFSFG